MILLRLVTLGLTNVNVIERADH